MEDYFNEDDIKAPAWDTGLVRRMLPYLRNWRPHFLLSVLLVLAGTAIQIMLPLLLGKTVDLGIKAKNHELLWHYVLLYGSAHLAFFALSAARNWLLQYTGQQVLHELRNDLFSHIQKLPISFFDRTPVGRLVTRITNDVSTLAEIFSAALINVSGEICVIIGIGAMMLVLHWKLGLAALLTAPVLFYVAWILKVKMRDAFRLARAKLAMLNSSLAENISGMSVIHIFNQEKAREAKFDQMNSDLREAELTSVFYNSFFVPAVTIFSAITLAIVTTYGGWLVSTGEISIGLLITFIAYVQAFFDPVRQISEQISVFQSAMASAERVFSLIDEKAEPDLDSGREFTDLQDEIEFRDLDFSYNPDKEILKGLSFKIKKGERVAIVGHTGAGKTTLASLLKRFYDYQSGQILLDGIDLREFSRSSLRRRIGLIQQDVNIFSGTILDNIFLAEGSFDQAKLDRITSELQMETLIKKLPQGIETQIYERGSNISAGQRQLIAFSRALVTDPKILILDEATSSVDSETESIIQHSVKHLTSQRTSLIIAHRLSTIRNCNRILVLHHGRLVEQGTHEELLEHKGHYHKLYELQFAEGDKP
ncbi:MAG: ABC transporter ATP-binding protein/permease [Candidatus Riflebacteria bacterium]|nr:ABC transporter ATP-binding protein/permease [Candidatus Riflebacteria bacterium]